MHAVGCLVLFLFAFVLTLVAIVRNTVQVLFGGKSSVRDLWRWFTGAKGRTSSWSGQRESSAGGQSTSSSSSQKTSSGKKKVFSDDEGEYVDFEEMK